MIISIYRRGTQGGVNIAVVCTDLQTRLWVELGSSDIKFSALSMLNNYLLDAC